jgi:putative hemolysin
MMSAFFSASETALMSLNKIRLRQKIDSGNKTAALISRMLESPDKLLSTILIGNNVVNITASALATSIAINLFGSKGVGIATGIMTLLVLIFAEITPKSLAAGSAERIAMLVARPINLISYVLTPIVFILTAVTGLLLRIAGQKASAHQSHVTEEELKTMMDVSHEEGMLEEDEKRLLEKVFEFGDEQVRYVMVPRTEITAVELDSNFDEISSTFARKRCSRLPVYEETLDSIIGILHIKDFFIHSGHGRDFNLQSLIRKPFYTIESKRIADLFEEMRSKKIQMAVVVDEYGGTAGIITMQDIVEVIFGDIDDEHDLDDTEIENIGQDEYLVNGSVRLKDLNDVLQTELESDDFETIGGLITGKAGRIPAKGDVIEFDSLTCQVIERTRTKINKIRISLTHPEDADKSMDGANGYEE